jgi:hypothetical protein
MGVLSLGLRTEEQIRPMRNGVVRARRRDVSSAIDLKKMDKNSLLNSPSLLSGLRARDTPDKSASTVYELGLAGLFTKNSES